MSEIEYSTTEEEEEEYDEDDYDRDYDYEYYRRDRYRSPPEPKIIKFERKSNVYDMQVERFKLFADQDTEKGNFDITFDFDGKKLHAHKIMLTTSEPLMSLISDRWNTATADDNGDKSVKIETFTYENFYRFLCFIYSGECELNKENILTLTDMAEFFDVPLLKGYCDQWLTANKRCIGEENIYDFIEVARRYSMTDFMNEIERLFNRNLGFFVRGDIFLDVKKEVVEILSKFNRHDNQKEEDFFKAVFQWAESRVRTAAAGTETEESVIQEAIKDDLKEILPSIDTSQFDLEYILSYIIPSKSYLFTAAELFKMLVNTSRYGNKAEEDFFKAVYELAEKEAMKKKETSNDESFNITGAIKAELAEILPQVQFYRMSESFSTDFIVSDKRYLFEPAELYKILLKSYQYHDKDVEGFFKTVYELAEKEAMKKQQASNNEAFNITGAIKAELSGILSEVKFHQMCEKFLTEFIVPDKCYLFESGEIYKIMLKSCRCHNKDEEQLFKTVYELAEKEVTQKQETSNDEVFNITDAIKTELFGILPEVRFHQMSEKFLSEFVVAKGILSRDAALRVRDIMVRVQNGDKTLIGICKDVCGMFGRLSSGINKVKQKCATKQKFNNLKFQIPRTSSTVTKMKGCEWYLCLEKDGALTVKFHSKIAATDYLISELKPQSSSGFLIGANSPTFISATHKKIF